MQQSYEGSANEEIIGWGGRQENPAGKNGKGAHIARKKLSDLISVEVLQKVQDDFSAAVGVAIVIVDPDGVPVTQPSGFTPFCNTVRKMDKLRERCFHCDAVGGRIALSTGEPSIYKCHCGLVDFAAPIIMKDQYLGAVVGGQVHLTDLHEGADLEDMSNLFASGDSWDVDKQLVELHEGAWQLPYDRLKSAAYSLLNIASHLAEESYSNTVSQELYVKNMRLMEESKKRAELERSLREAELQALSYQVNPHFLFNVLNTISRLALIEDAGETEKTVHAFADMMRYILKKSGNQFAPLGTEVEHVKNYLYLQKLRLGDRFDVSLDVPEEFNEVLCPFMILQPIVENCINYAVEPRESGGFIKINAYSDVQDLIVDIEDNGEGISQKRKQSVLKGESEHGNRKSIGIFNVGSRLQHFFGEEYALEIVSPYRQGKGTLVRIRLPLEFDPCAFQMK
ncbi:Histidine kinase-, DNA gyrase B-, and HSP90-like ATPase [Cohaesibacter marisflavi]|uniref:Histidine kinase-, DNA gyrase B-, and HSP90-like ATPase n=1 Tax=Cohaesibacter marisflavi TaxID=655353 RepID=A0A1I5FJM1_9HYPH|nr:PocR ligand-binding domain-containing protein [Cohaesibacter marisflavi]SFO23998.1 Histidine kinase-, DNA gyrase B-, and HSP90-like ATPase [Cohaesibacter marisflavi]